MTRDRQQPRHGRSASPAQKGPRRAKERLLRELLRHRRISRPAAEIAVDERPMSAKQILQSRRDACLPRLSLETEATMIPPPIDGARAPKVTARFLLARLLRATIEGGEGFESALATSRRERRSPLQP